MAFCSAHNARHTLHVTHCTIHDARNTQHVTRCTFLTLWHSTVSLPCRYMMMRNLDQARGLVNGGEVVLVAMRTNSITVRLSDGTQAVLPRINCVVAPDDSGLPFVLHRRQYPIIPSFALTVHRVQGQSLLWLGIHFSGDVFCHGMLFTALSRVRSWANICVFCGDAQLLSESGIAQPAAVVLKNLVLRHIVAHLR